MAYQLSKNSNLNGESFNFSNDKIRNLTVLSFVKKLKKKWSKAKWKIIKNKSFRETTLLQLNNRKSKKILNWRNVLSIEETANLVSSWYYNFCFSKTLKIDTLKQIKYFMNLLGR